MTIKVMNIKIVSVPDGEAPLEVREKWVGLELPVVPGESYAQQGVVSGKPVNPPMDGYLVKAVTAVAILAKSDRDAARWWETHFLPKYKMFEEQTPEMIANAFLVFEKEVCEIVKD